MSKLSKGLGGAASGAALGTAFLPGIGTAIGAGLGGLAGLFDDSDEQAMEELRKNQELYGAIDTPDFKDYKPEDYQYVGDYKPEEYSGQTINEDPSIRSSQMSVLSKLAGLADTGLSDVDQAGYERAKEQGNQLANSANAAAMQNAQARGVGGSGLEFAMREAANQAGAGRAMDAGLTLSADSAKMRALYEQAYGSALSGQRAQDFGVNSANTDIINKYNQMNTQGANQAQALNLQNRQNIGNMNTQGHNQAQTYNNDLQQREYDDQMKKAAGQSGANKDMAGGYAAENAANTSQMNQLASAGIGLYGAMNPNGAKKKKLDGTLEVGSSNFDPSNIA